ncbi:filamin-C-like [Oppia nitens]|uniref:filamin-C-like n=1 Tax=Oppia nitens TaxID=1686743 RepID=UPI0023DAA76B|nr:filamin-C-like [Oppia nitens]
MAEINVFGPGLSGGETGKKCMIYASGASCADLDDGLTVAVSGPGGSKVDVMTDFSKPNDDGNVEAYYFPLVSGDYKITVRFRGRQLKGSPFTVKITGDVIDAEKLLSRVAVHGRGYELGKAYAMNEFVVDCSGLKPVIGSLRVHMKGPERSAAQLNIRDNKNGTFKVSYKPTSPGMYIMNIKIAETHIPGSPFQVKVTEFLSNK